MEITAEEDHMFSIWGSKQTIDNYIRNNDYHSAFNLCNSEENSLNFPEL